MVPAPPWMAMTGVTFFIGKLFLFLAGVGSDGGGEEGRHGNLAARRALAQAALQPRAHRLQDAAADCAAPGARRATALVSASISEARWSRSWGGSCSVWQ